MANANEVFEFPGTQGAHFKMIDVGRKRTTRRRAVACGSIFTGAEAFERIRAGTLPKGDVLGLAEAAGIMAAKKTPDTLPMCHTLPLDQVTVHCHLDPQQHCVTVYCQAAAFAKTGVEMEALAGAQAALLTIWDLTKGVEPALRIGDVRLLVKTGGKSGVWIHPDGIPAWLRAQLPDPQPMAGTRVAIQVMSDRAARGDYEDASGNLLRELLQAAGAEPGGYRLVPDDPEAIAKALQATCDEEQPDLLIASGGTGPGPRDITPEILTGICDRMLDGLGELMRRESAAYTDTAWLSRMTAGVRGNTLVVAFPGSPKAVRECWEIIEPFIGTALKRMGTQGFAKKERKG